MYLYSMSTQKTTLIQILSKIEDPRHSRTQIHDLGEILTIAACAMLCGAESFNDMEHFGTVKEPWLKTFLRLSHGVPSHDTFNRVFSMINPTHFMEAFVEWTQTLRLALDRDIVAIDGKALRRASKKGSRIPQVVSAWSRDNGLCLGQIQVDEKSNEITAVPKLLRQLDLAGCIVTIDAMGCQKKIAKEIHEADADYVLALKGNQETVHDEVKAFLDEEVRLHLNTERKTPSTLLTFETTEKDHGRLEVRRYYLSTKIDWFQDRAQWENLRCVGMVESIRSVTGEAPSLERRYYLGSIPADARLFAKAVRGHWSVENNLHWCMDVLFREDLSRARSGHASQNLATLRRLSLNLLKKSSKKCSLRQKRLNAGWDSDYLKELLTQNIESPL
jgi:predicted transposase YbfD/YdcC